VMSEFPLAPFLQTSSQLPDLPSHRILPGYLEPPRHPPRWSA
jgi:hypothetical protein